MCVCVGGVYVCMYVGSNILQVEILQIFQLVKFKYGSVGELFLLIT